LAFIILAFSLHFRSIGQRASRALSRAVRATIHGSQDVRTGTLDATLTVA